MAGDCRTNGSNSGDWCRTRTAAPPPAKDNETLRERRPRKHPRCPGGCPSNKTARSRRRIFRTRPENSPRGEAKDLRFRSSRRATAGSSGPPALHGEASTAGIASESADHTLCGGPRERPHSRIPYGTSRRVRPGKSRRRYGRSGDIRNRGTTRRIRPKASSGCIPQSRSCGPAIRPTPPEPAVRRTHAGSPSNPYRREPRVRPDNFPVTPQQSASTTPVPRRSIPAGKQERRPPLPSYPYAIFSSNLQRHRRYARRRAPQK